jgi:cbb3-type cytochrome oxidase subunit 3
MNLTDVVSHAGFSGYAQIGFLISLVAFLGVVAWAFLRPKAEMQAHAQVVLEDDDTDTRHEGHHEGYREGYNDRWQT